MQAHGQPHHQNELAIVEASEALFQYEGYQNFGTSVDLYQFTYHPPRGCNDGDSQERKKTWEKGKIFHGNREQDLSFGELIEHNRGLERDAVFLVHEATKREALEEMMVRSLELKGVGILKTYGAGYNNQISKVVSSYRPTTSSFADWLQAEAQKPASNSIAITIPTAVQHVIRIGYRAIEMMWAKGCTSDDLANVDSYHMIGDWVQIDPLCIRARYRGENDIMPVRQAFSKMILDHIYSKWEDGELLDLIDLLRNEQAWDERSILGAPVLLDPARRETMYQRYHNARPITKQMSWLDEYANPGSEWQTYASNEDSALKSIIKFQKGGFSLDFSGAMHFGSVVTSHYDHHFKITGGNPQDVDMKTQVDLVLKKVLRRLLSKRYNSEYAYKQWMPRRS